MQYSINFSDTGSIANWIGVINKGTQPLVFSNIIAINLSKDPTTALWIIIGVWFLSLVSLYLAPNLSGKLKSIWIVPHCHSLPRESSRVNSILGP